MNFKFAKFISIALLICVLIPRLPLVKAATIDYLDAPKDIISNDTPEAFAMHNIRFGLPTGSQTLHVDDYLIINFVYFSNVQAPIFLGGGFTGTPEYTINGNTLTITGIELLPDNYLSINDLRAKNPSIPGAFDVYIKISPDANGAITYNRAHILATSTDGSVIVRAEVPANNGQIIVSGQAGPNMLIAFTENNVNIGTCLSDGAGAFSQLMSGFSPNEHLILVYGTDFRDRYTPSVEIRMFIQPYIVTQVSGIIIPPTIELDKTEITRGEPLTASGISISDWGLTTYTEPPLQSYEDTVASNGSYSYTLTNTNDFELGDHVLYTLVHDNIGNKSLFSFSLNFKVVDPSVDPPDGDPACDISQGDLSCDSRTNLTDFSILLYYWASTSPLADINNDGLVNLIDFSIMMFFWQT